MDDKFIQEGIKREHAVKEGIKREHAVRDRLSDKTMGKWDEMFKYINKGELSDFLYDTFLICKFDKAFYNRYHVTKMNDKQFLDLKVMRFTKRIDYLYDDEFLRVKKQGMLHEKDISFYQKYKKKEVFEYIKQEYLKTFPLIKQLI